jgi:hypothetical protein
MLKIEERRKKNSIVSAFIGYFFKFMFVTWILVVNALYLQQFKDIIAHLWANLAGGSN